MSDSITLAEQQAARPANSAPVEIFDPPLCCPTGMCGPTIDPVLLDVNEMILTLQSEGIAVARYQLAGQTQAFVSNRQVLSLIREKHMAALPHHRRQWANHQNRRLSKRSFKCARR